MARPVDPTALRRTGKQLHVLIPPEEFEAYQRKADANGEALAEVVRRLLAKWLRSMRA